jgi:hypothetical protein
MLGLHFVFRLAAVVLGSGGKFVARVFRQVDLPRAFVGVCQKKE